MMAGILSITRGEQERQPSSGGTTELRRSEALVVQSNPAVSGQIRSSDLEFMARSTGLG